MTIERLLAEIEADEARRMPRMPKGLTRTGAVDGGSSGQKARLDQPDATTSHPAGLRALGVSSLRGPAEEVTGGSSLTGKAVGEGKQSHQRRVCRNPPA